jgi:hypothetical protein
MRLPDCRATEPSLTPQLLEASAFPTHIGIAGYVSRSLASHFCAPQLVASSCVLF